ncbi:MAG: amidohydrolase family protein [Proteobacteria bacterium]|nr:amidohydrolase family protein [Pseudomonadota bacterium]
MKALTNLMPALLLAASPAVAESTVIINVNVIPMTSETVLSARTVIVTDGEIVTIGDVDDTPVPDDAVVVDGTDRFLMPGLFEMHGHVPGLKSRDLDRVLHLFVANGITTVRGMLGQQSHLELRSALQKGDRLGPRLYTSGPSLNGRSVTSPERAISMAEQQHAAGYDFLKIHPGLTREEFDAMAATANRVGIRFAGHVPEDVGIRRALAAGIATVDHLDGYMESLLRPNDDPSGGLSGFFGVFIADQADETKIAEIAAATAEAGVWNVPTESLFRHATSSESDPDDMVDWPEMKYMPADTVARWHRAKRDILDDVNYKPDTAARAVALRQQLILALHHSGAGLLLGSDSPQIFNVPGFAIHRELEYLVDAGLTPYEALQTGTTNPAEFFGRPGVLGVVKTGAVADLILLDANPLDDITNTRRIHGVMVRGRWLPRSELDGLLDRLAR